MRLDNVLELSYEELASYTGNFSEKNYLGHFQFGKLYRGKINWTQDVTVKIWEVPEIYDYESGDNELRLMDEIILLRHEMVITHPGMVKLYGYCWEGDHLGVVYEFKPFDSLFNLIPKDDFTWMQRIKVALKFASLLKFLHARRCSSYKPFIVRNLDVAHLVLDEDYNPKLCDFGLITGGIFPDRTVHTTHHVIGCYGYIDVSAFYTGDFSDKIDVFAFGAILISLISKSVYTKEDRQASAPFPYKLAFREHEAYEEEKESKPKPKFSFAHESLVEEPDFCPFDAHKLTMLGMGCINGPGCQRPTMNQVLKSLLKLNVVKKNPNFFGLDKLFQCLN